MFHVAVRRWQLGQEKKREHRRQADEQLATDLQHWQTNVERQRAREEAALRFELSVAERERNRQWEARALNRLETDGGLQEFERNAQRLGLPIPQLAKPAAVAASSSGGDGSGDDDSSGGALALTASEKRQLEAAGGGPAATPRADGWTTI